jgi:mono/diheme cytochrome c family protein
MGRVLVCSALISLVTLGSATAQDQVARGAKVYADQKCSVCHSIAGKGNAKGTLDGVGAKLSANDIRAWMVDAVGQTAKTKAARKPAMKNYALPKEDVDALVAYLSTLKK